MMMCSEVPDTRVIRVSVKPFLIGIKKVMSFGIICKFGYLESYTLVKEAIRVISYIWVIEALLELVSEFFELKGH